MLFVGIAGALKNDIALGDVVAVTRVEAYQGGKDAAVGFKTRPETWPGARRLLQVAQYVEANASWLKFLPDIDTNPVPNVHFKPIASGGIVKDTNDSPLAALLDTAYNEAAAIEMEAAGVAPAADHPGVDLMVIRGISDHPTGPRHPATAAAGSNGRRRLRHAAAFALGVIAALPAPDPVGGSAPAQGAATPSGTDATPDWSLLEQAPAVSWRTELYQAYATEPATLELHLVPGDANARLQVAGLQTLWDELVQLGRIRGLFGQARAVEGGPRPAARSPSCAPCAAAGTRDSRCCAPGSAALGSRYSNRITQSPRFLIRSTSPNASPLCSTSCLPCRSRCRRGSSPSPGSRPRCWLPAARWARRTTAPSRSG